jgi:hypothetical protein
MWKEIAVVYFKHIKYRSREYSFFFLIESVEIDGVKEIIPTDGASLVQRGLSPTRRENEAEELSWPLLSPFFFLTFFGCNL